MNGHKSFLVLQFMAMSFFWTCNAQPRKEANNKEARIEIAESNSKYFQALLTGDSSLFVNLYTDDCWIMPADAPTLCGIDASLDFFKMIYHESGVGNGRLTTTEIYGDGEGFVTETGLFQFVDSNNKIVKNGTFITLWKKTKNGWKMFRNSFSR
jgi:ketosteroid isomerase-like protein